MGNSGNEILGNGKKALDRIIGLDPAGKFRFNLKKNALKNGNIFNI